LFLPYQAGSFSGVPDFSWCDFAREIFFKKGRATRVSPIAAQNYLTLATLRLNSPLNFQTTEQEFGILDPDWRAGPVESVTELGITK